MTFRIIIYLCDWAPPFAIQENEHPGPHSASTQQEIDFITIWWKEGKCGVSGGWRQGGGLGEGWGAVPARAMTFSDHGEADHRRGTPIILSLPHTYRDKRPRLHVVEAALDYGGRGRCLSVADPATAVATQLSVNQCKPDRQGQGHVSQGRPSPATPSTQQGGLNVLCECRPAEHDIVNSYIMTSATGHGWVRRTHIMTHSSSYFYTVMHWSG